MTVTAMDHPFLPERPSLGLESATFHARHSLTSLNQEQNLVAGWNNGSLPSFPSFSPFVHPIPISLLSQNPPPSLCPLRYPQHVSSQHVTFKVL